MRLPPKINKPRAKAIKQEQAMNKPKERAMKDGLVLREIAVDAGQAAQAAQADPVALGREDLVALGQGHA